MATELHEKQLAFLDWLVLPEIERQPQTQRAWGEQNDVGHSTLANWKRDPLFRAEWDRRLAELNINPQRVQKAVDTVYSLIFDTNARDSDRIKAFEVYARYIGRMTPRAGEDILDKATKRVEDMSDEELHAAYEAHVTSLDKERAKRSSGRFVS